MRSHRGAETQRYVLFSVSLSLCGACLELGTWDLSEEKTIGGVIGFDCVFVAESFQKRSEAGKIPIFDFKAREDAAEVGSMVSVVEQADVPSPRERVEEVRERAGTFGKLEAAQRLVLHFGCVAADHVADVKLGHLVVRQIDCFVPRAAKLRDERIGILA